MLDTNKLFARCQELLARTRKLFARSQKLLALRPKPLSRTRKLLARGQKLLALSAKPLSRTRKLLARSQEPLALCQKPLARTRKLLAHVPETSCLRLLFVHAHTRSSCLWKSTCTSEVVSVRKPLDVCKNYLPTLTEAVYVWIYLLPGLKPVQQVVYNGEK